MSQIGWQDVLDVLKWLLPPGIILTFLWKFIERQIDRGRRRVEEAAPRIIALGNRAPTPSLALELNNIGKGEAINVIFSLDGCNRSSSPLARLAPGGNATTEQLFYNDSPIYTQPLENPRLHIHYQSVHGLTYQTVYRVTQQQRANGNYNPQIDLGSQSFVEPQIRWYTYFKIGK